MKKRIFGILLTLCMVICLMPTGIIAESKRTVDVGSAQGLVDALADTTADIVKLSGNISLQDKAPTVAREVVLDLNGYVLQGDGRRVFEVQSGGHLIIADSNTSTVHRFTRQANGPWRSDNNGTETVKGGIITGGNAEEGGGVRVCAGGKLTMNGGSIVGCRSNANGGGGVSVDGDGTFEMNDGAAIIGCFINYSRRSGGGVACDGVFTMNGGRIASCKSDNWGGGVYVQGDGLFTMNGGLIEDCETSIGTNTGSAISCYDSNATLTLNGTMRPKTDKDSWVIFAQSLSGPKAVIGADADIEGNVYFSAYNLYPNGGVVRGDLYANWSIKVIVDESVTKGTLFYGALTGNCNYNIDGVAVTYKVDGADYAAQFLRAGTLATQPITPAKTNQTFDGWYKADGTKWDFTTAVTESITLTGELYVPVDSASALESALADSAAKVIRLTKDIDIDKTLTVDRAVTVDLNGHVLEMTGSGSVFALGNSGDLTVIDSEPAAEHRFKDDGSGRWVSDEQGDKAVSGGVITGGNAENGGGVYADGGQFTMIGGTIAGCKADEGSGVYLLGGTMNANGGTVDGTVVLCYNNTAAKAGVIQSNGSSGVTVFEGDVTAAGEIRHGAFFGKVTLGFKGYDGTISGGVFNGQVNTGVGKNNGGISGGVFNDTVTVARGTVSDGTFNKNVVVNIVYNGIPTLTGGTYNGLITNNNGDAVFGGACGELGIVGIKPTKITASPYYTVTFDPADGTMEYPERYFYENRYISGEIKPTRTGYFFAGWYNGENAWDHSVNVVTGDLTLTAHWTACDHSGHTGAQPTCTTSVTCTACGGTINALGHAFTEQKYDNDHHWMKCSRCDATDGLTEHVWDNGTVTVSATCTVAGNKVFACTKCPATKNESLDAKGHNWSREWQHDPTHHWHKCNNCTEKIDLSGHSGGEATCTAEAVCQYCRVGYGKTDPANHKNGKQVWTKTETTHEQKWDCCGAVTVVNAAHEWENGVCTVCSYACSHADGNNDHICDLCSKVISNHADADNDHICDLCKKVISNHADADNDHVCDLCKKVISNHADKDNDHICDLCKKVISNHADTDNDHVCDLCKKVISNHADKDDDHICDFCKKVISNHEDADNNHVCDICDKVISNHLDGNNDHICDLCKKVISNHTGGVATCKERALCEICQNAFGACDPNNHTNLAHFPAKAAAADAEGNIEYWYCDGCDRYFADKDGKYPIEKGETVTKKLPPQIISGNGAAVTQGEETALSFTSDAAFSDFIRAELDGETLDEKYYDKKAGSTIITLHADYVATLSAGEHTLSIVSQSGTATATFTVAAKPAEQPVEESAKTGDSNPALLWILLLFVSGGVLTGATVGLRKKKHPAK